MKKIIGTLLLGLTLNACSCAVAEKDEPGRWTVWSQHPAEKWQDAFVTGNGRHGMIVPGRPDNERITCVHEELFIRGWDHRKQTVPVTSQLMPKVARLMNEGRTDEASKLLTDEADRQLREMGANQRWPLIPHPAFDLCIQMQGAEAEGVSGYRRQLNLETGEATAFWKQMNAEYEENAFSSRTDHVNVIRLKAGAGSKLQLSLSLEETPGRSGEWFEHNLDSAFRSVGSEVEPGWLAYHAEYSKDPNGYEGLARVTTRGGHSVKKEGKLWIEDADEVLVVMRITPLQAEQPSAKEAVKEELQELSDDYDELLASHRREHQRMFNRMQLDLGCAKQWKETPVEKMLETSEQQGVTPLFLEQVHAMGRYLLISSSGKYAPALQGIWAGGWKPAWIGGFVWDSNINLAVSAASMSNLPECAESYNNYVKSLLPGWRLNAKNYLGCRGFIVAHYNDPENGYLTHFGASFPWMFWAGGAGWNIRPLYEYAMMMGDTRYLKEEVFPLYQEIGQFYEDFLVMGSDGLYHISPSISPENAPEGTDTWLSRDATMDVAIAREVFGLLCKMGHDFGASASDLGKWKNYLNKLPFYRVNEDGALAEWVDESYPDIYDHRHNSHLYPVFPGTELRHCTVDGIDWTKAVGIALDKRFAFDTSSAHGLIHLALQAARLKKLDIVEQNIDRFSRRGYLYNSLVTSHEPKHAIYNLDAILSFPRLLMEMVAFSAPGQLELLPAWPASYPDGSIRGMRLYGGHTLDIAWKDGKLVSATLLAGSDDELELVNGDSRKNLKLEKGEKYSL